MIGYLNVACTFIYVLLASLACGTALNILHILRSFPLEKGPLEGAFIGAVVASTLALVTSLLLVDTLRKNSSIDDGTAKEQEKVEDIDYSIRPYPSSYDMRRLYK